MNRYRIAGYIIIVAVLFVVASCGVAEETSLYSWHNYENMTYTYVKRGDTKHYVKMMNQYAKMNKKQVGVRKTVPPGFNAEYGYLLLKEGKKEDALDCFNREIELYPESKTFVSRIIKQIEGQ